MQLHLFLQSRDKDGELNREDYIENAMKAYELDGKLYAIMRCFGISTVIGKTSDVGSGAFHLAWAIGVIFHFVRETVGCKPDWLSYNENKRYYD